MTTDEVIEKIETAVSSYTALSDIAFNVEKAMQYREALQIAISALRIQQEMNKNAPLTQSQLRNMHREMVYCLELNMRVKVISCREGLIDIYYESPGSHGTFHAKDLTLYRIDDKEGDNHGK